MAMTKEQWEIWAINTYGSISEAKQAMAEKGRVGGTITKERGHLERIGFQNMSKEEHLAYASEGGKKGHGRLQSTH